MNVRTLLGKLSPSQIADALGGVASAFPLPTGRPEPVLVLDVCKLAVTVAAGYGWIVLPTPEQAEVASGAAAAVWLICSWLTRDQVTPKSAPKNDVGDDLVSVSHVPPLVTISPGAGTTTAAQLVVDQGKHEAPDPPASPG